MSHAVISVYSNLETIYVELVSQLVRQNKKLLNRSGCLNQKGHLSDDLHSGSRGKMLMLYNPICKLLKLLLEISFLPILRSLFLSIFTMDNSKNIVYHIYNFLVAA